MRRVKSTRKSKGVITALARINITDEGKFELVGADFWKRTDQRTRMVKLARLPKKIQKVLAEKLN